MPASLPVPCKLRRGTSGTDYYYFDGIWPPTSLGGGVGTTLNTIAGGALTITDLPVADFDALADYFQTRTEALGVALHPA